MSNENYEVTEETTYEPTEVYEGTVEETEESKGGLGVAALVIGGGLAVAGLAAAGIIGFALGRNGSCDCEEISDSTEDVVDPE